MDRATALAKMQARLESSGIGYEEIKVFGAIRCNVHITCISRDTANKWVALLSQVFDGAPVRVVETVWNAKKNMGSNLLPTLRYGYLIGVAA